MNIHVGALSLGRIRKQLSFSESFTRAYAAVENILSKQVFKVVGDVHDLTTLLLEIECFSVVLDLDEFEGLL